jgi:hypothetical protein
MPVLPFAPQPCRSGESRELSIFAALLQKARG